MCEVALNTDFCKAICTVMQLWRRSEQYIYSYMNLLQQESSSEAWDQEKRLSVDMPTLKFANQVVLFFFLKRKKLWKELINKNVGVFTKYKVGYLQKNNQCLSKDVARSEDFLQRG